MNNENLINENIICPKCGTSIMPSTKICPKCGNTLQTESSNTENINNLINPQLNTETIKQNVATQEKTNNQQFGTQPSYNYNNTNTKKMSYFNYIFNAILKPYDSFKKEESNLSKFKNPGILLALIVGILTILNLISTIYSSVRVTSIWSDEVEWVWENLQDIEYFKIIGQDLLIYAGFVFSISGIYFFASLVIKKETNYVKILSATTTAFIPLAISMSILSPLLSLIHSSLGTIITTIGFIYFLMILIELLNDQIVIENKNTRIYFHLTCLSVVLIGGSFIAYKLILGSLTSGLGSLF